MANNEKLETLLSWAKYHGIDLDRATFDLNPTFYSWDKTEDRFDLRVTFNHDKETREQSIRVKKAIGGFDPIEAPGTKTPILSKVTETPSGSRIKVVWDSAFKCEVSYRCEPKGFEDEEGVKP